MSHKEYLVWDSCLSVCFNGKYYLAHTDNECKVLSGRSSDPLEGKFSQAVYKFYLALYVLLENATCVLS